MNPYHVVMDACLWFCSVLWLVGFLARGPKYRTRNRKLKAPSPLCERTGKFEVNLGNTIFARRQGD